MSSVWQQALEELRKETKKRKFNQTLDLVINLKGVDLRKDNVNAVISIPHKVKEKKVCGCLMEKSDLVKSVLKPDFSKYKDKAALRHLVKEFDFFIAHASLMPAVAITFGRALGPAGKMPSPQLGIVTKETPEVINSLLDRISKSVKIRIKEPSFKIPVGKENMKDEDIIENMEAVYNGVVDALPTKKENVKNVSIKFTMSKPRAIGVK